MSNATYIAILMTLVACAREPLEYGYDSYREVCEYNIDLGQLLRTSTEDWVQNNLPNLEPYQYDFLNKVLVPSLAEEMKYGLPLEVTTAQAILESGWGRSELAAKYNNYFGIKEYRKNKCGVKLYSDEYVKGNKVSIRSKFRVYDTPAHCFADRSEWFLGNNRYQDLDFKGIDCFQFAIELQKRGYATDINYTIRLSRIIKKYKLCEYSAWVKRSI